MSLRLFHVDAFTGERFKGNPAAVCPLEAWLDDEVLRAVASENNLSETAYFVPEEDGYRLRWFTPRCEVTLCGHATLAAGFVLLKVLNLQQQQVSQEQSLRFATRSGLLTVRREGDLLSMDFPALSPWVCAEPPRELIEGLSAGDVTVLQIKDNYFVVYETEEDVREIGR